MKILVPTDFTINALHAFEIAIKFAIKFGASIDLIHIEKEAFRLSDEYDLLNPEVSPAYNKQFNLFIGSYIDNDDFKHHLKAINIQSFLSFGSPELIINKLSKQYDLIVIGARGQNNFHKKIIGSIAESVINNALCPVITVPVKHNKKSIERFILCEDFEALDTDILNFFEKLDKISPIEVSFYHAVEVKDNENDHRLRNHTMFKVRAFQKLATKEFYYDKAIKSIPDAIVDYATQHKEGIVTMVFRESKTSKRPTNLITEIFRKGEIIILSFYG